MGGLGRVSVDIPMALNVHAKMDCRVLQPITRFTTRLQANLAENERFRPTGLELSFKTQGGGKQKYALHQTYEEATRTWVYGIKNELWELFDHLYFPVDIRFTDPVLNDAYGTDAIFNANMMFVRVACAFAQYLDPATKLAPDLAIKQFDDRISYIFLHDWLTGQAAEQILHVGLDACTRLFMIHNVYDHERSIQKAEAAGIVVPAYVKAEAKRALKEGKRALKYSPLRTGIRESDWLIVDGNYLQTLTAKETRLNSNIKEELRKKNTSGRYTTVAHAPNRMFNPIDNHLLQGDGFTSLPSDFFAKAQEEQIEILAKYVEKNRSALQRKHSNSKNYWGYLAETRDAVIYCWAARFEPYQKGFFLLASEAKKFLLDHPKAQLVIGGGGGTDAETDILVDRFFKDLLNEESLHGRFVRAGDVDESGHVKKLDDRGLVQLLAGSSAIIHPSIYEPYGLSQLEAMWLGAVPIGHAVDGLLSTIRDADEAPYLEQAPSRPDPSYGQNGFLMKRMSSPKKYDAALRRWVAWEAGSSLAEPVSKPDQRVLAEANANFLNALERSFKALSDENSYLQIVLNGMNYIRCEHDWAQIAKSYETAIRRAKR